MAKNKHKKNKNNNLAGLLCKKLPVFLYVACGLVIFFAAFWFFLIYNNAPDSIYVFPENPKQGDTVFIRVKSGSDNITGSFRNEELVFYRKGKLQEWVAFLGIDVDQEPGDYKIYVSTSDTQVLTKEIKISRWKTFKFGKVFKFERGKRLITLNQIKGEIPYISSTKKNNGIDNYINPPDYMKVYEKRKQEKG